MSITQPTIRDHLLKQKETLQGYLALLKKHEPSWKEAEQYSAKRTRNNLNKQLKELDKVISWCEED